MEHGMVGGVMRMVRIKAEGGFAFPAMFVEHNPS